MNEPQPRYYPPRYCDKDGCKTVTERYQTVTNAGKCKQCARRRSCMPPKKRLRRSDPPSLPQLRSIVNEYLDATVPIPGLRTPENIENYRRRIAIVNRFMVTSYEYIAAPQNDTSRGRILSSGSGGLSEEWLQATIDHDRAALQAGGDVQVNLYGNPPIPTPENPAWSHYSYNLRREAALLFVRLGGTSSPFHANHNSINMFPITLGELREKHVPAINFAACTDMNDEWARLVFLYYMDAFPLAALVQTRVRYYQGDTVARYIEKCDIGYHRAMPLDTLQFVQVMQWAHGCNNATTMAVYNDVHSMRSDDILIRRAYDCLREEAEYILLHKFGAHRPSGAKATYTHCTERAEGLLARGLEGDDVWAALERGERPKEPVIPPEPEPPVAPSTAVLHSWH